MPGNLCTVPGVPPTPLSQLSSSLHRLTDETDITVPGQMACQTLNPWLRPKPGSIRQTTTTTTSVGCRGTSVVAERLKRS